MIKILVLLTVFFLVGCTATQKLDVVQKKSQYINKPVLKKVVKKSTKTNLKIEKKLLFVKKILLNPQECTVPRLTAEEKSLKRSVALLEAYLKKWRSVKYRFGGSSRRGIDCSAFVQQAFKKQFNFRLPRNTHGQVKRGKTIPKSKLKTGDLVFFKTSRRVRHVGIYLKDNKFIHASSSKGVTQSSLKNVYWAKKYWKAKRLSFKSSIFFDEVLRLGRV
ncbi:MAG: C40 family peptidase [Methylococcales bacterium]|nr:C40 family peptidase [Methylococcales bacterium]